MHTQIFRDQEGFDVNRRAWGGCPVNEQNRIKFWWFGVKLWQSQTSRLTRHMLTIIVQKLLVLIISPVCVWVCVSVEGRRVTAYLKVWMKPSILFFIVMWIHRLKKKKAKICVISIIIIPVTFHFDWVRGKLVYSTASLNKGRLWLSPFVWDWWNKTKQKPTWSNNARQEGWCDRGGWSTVEMREGDHASGEYEAAFSVMNP